MYIYIYIYILLIFQVVKRCDGYMGELGLNPYKKKVISK